jgi:TPR repeat protein
MRKWIVLITTILVLYSIVSRASDLLVLGQDHPDVLVDGVNAWSEGNYTLAHELLRPLSVQGNVVAQYIIGLMYFRGKVVGKYYKESRRFVNLSAEQGYARAQHKLGNIYTGDLLGKPDYRKAIKWFRLASVQGYAPSQYFLATLYENGDGVKQDYVRAHMWFSLASGKNIIARDERDRIAKKMAPSQITEAQNMARYCEREDYKNCE